MRAIDLAASQRKIKLPAEVAVDAEIDSNLEGSNFFPAARLNVSLPGLERDVAQAPTDAAHEICPYSKAVDGNIAVQTNLFYVQHGRSEARVGRPSPVRLLPENGATATFARFPRRDIRPPSRR